MGMERLVLLLTTLQATEQDNIAADVYVTSMGADAYALEVAELLRDSCPSMRVMMHCGGGNFKKQLKRADKTGAGYAVLLGSEEAENKVATVKPLRSDGEQKTVALAELAGMLSELVD